MDPFVRSVVVTPPARVLLNDEHPRPLVACMAVETRRVQLYHEMEAAGCRAFRNLALATRMRLCRPCVAYTATTHRRYTCSLPICPWCHGRRIIKNYKRLHIDDRVPEFQAFWGDTTSLAVITATKKIRMLGTRGFPEHLRRTRNECAALAAKLNRFSHGLLWRIYAAPVVDSVRLRFEMWTRTFCIADLSSAKKRVTQLHRREFDRFEFTVDKLHYDPACCRKLLRQKLASHWEYPTAWLTAPATSVMDYLDMVSLRGTNTVAIKGPVKRSQVLRMGYGLFRDLRRTATEPEEIVDKKEVV